jgi:membrane protein CcdC involved in cytochrome C biogenesis
MTTTDHIKFSNSCGKIFADEIILATAHKESVIAVNDIKKVSFTSRPKPQSLLFVALPAVLFVFPFFNHSTDTFLNVLLIGLGVLLMAVSLYNLNKQHTLTVKLATGNSIAINVSPRNIKEAKKFAGMVKAKISRR